MSLSSGQPDQPDRAADSVQAATDFLNDQLASVTVDAPDAVTLSSESGNLGADVVNGLDQPVTVRIAVQSDGSPRARGPRAAGARPQCPEADPAEASRPTAPASTRSASS